MADDRLPPQFAAAEQQREAVTLGMWIFLGTELMMFGALLLGYTVYRQAFPRAWAAASQQLDLLLGTLNTAVLLTSSLCMALADGAVRQRARRRAVWLLAATATLGALFLGIKLVEYTHEFHQQLVPLSWLDFRFAGPPGGRLFFNFYFLLTGLHAVHLTLGIGLVLVQLAGVHRWQQPPQLERRVQASGLYWHFVDIVWIFLYPLLYLV